ncbi:putative UvrD/REP helicase [human gut metagenome]|uniref:Putative UvrD/REP helicase n=1 Tax=human gut metagenome TaxID=408170 RepID=W1YGN6_9ZZZZ
MSQPVRPELRYCADHEWINSESPARVGISAVASDALGEVVFVDLPEVGAELVRVWEDQADRVPVTGSPVHRHPRLAEQEVSGGCQPSETCTVVAGERTAAVTASVASSQWRPAR